MERRHIKWLPLLLAGLFFAYQYYSSEKFNGAQTVATLAKKSSATWQ